MTSCIDPNYMYANSASDPTGQDYIDKQKTALSAQPQTVGYLQEVKQSGIGGGAVSNGLGGTYIGDPTQPIYPPKPSCPNCGYCPHCGRSNPGYPTTYPQITYGGANTQYINAQAGQLYK